MSKFFILTYGFGLLAFGCFLAYLPYVSKLLKHESDEWEDYKPTGRERVWHRILLGVAVLSLFCMAVIGIIVGRSGH
jgi:hypothetical protein